MMKEKTTNPKKVKGTVLFTVVSVMMVLIVFLMATLALASTANSRAYANYQQVQTEDTARAAVDAVVQAINEDTAATGIRKALLNGTSVDVALSDKTGGAYHVNIKKTDQTKSTYDETNGWKNYDVYELSVIVNDMRLAEVTYNAYITAASVTKDPESPPPPPASGDGAFVAIGNLEGNIGTGGHISGGTYVGIDLPAGTLGDYTMGGAGATAVDAPVYINGTLTNAATEGGMTYHFKKQGEYVAIMGNFNADRLDTVYDDFVWDNCTLDYTTLPYFFIGKKLSLKGTTQNNGKQISIGSSDVATNVYCSEFETNSGTGLNMHGDIYAFDESATSKLNIGTSDAALGKLYSWTAKTLNNNNGGNQQFGNMFTAGNLRMEISPSYEIQGDLRVAKDLTIKGGSLTVSGDIYCGGTVTIETGTVSCDAVYASKIVNSGTLSCADNAYAPEYSGSEPSGKTHGSTDVAEEFGGGSIWYSDFTVDSIDYPNIWNHGQANAHYHIIKHTVGSSDTVTISNSVHTDWKGNNATWVQEEVQASNPEYFNNTSPETAITQAASHRKVNNLTVYPQAYNASNIQNTISLPTPTKANYNYTDTIAELKAEKGSSIDYYTVTAGGVSKTDGSDMDADEQAETAAAYYKKADNTYYVGASCVLSGYFDNHVYIDSTSNPVTVIIDNVSFANQKNIYINDTKGVTLFIKNSLTMEGSLVTEKIWNDVINGSGSVTIYQMNASADADYFPNVTIYADEAGASFTLQSSENVVSALIQAPSLTYKQGLGKAPGSGIKYVTHNGSEIDNIVAEAKDNAINVIGQLIAGEISAPTDKGFTLLYETLGATATQSSYCQCSDCEMGPDGKCHCSCGKCTCNPTEPTDESAETLPTEATTEAPVTLTDGKDMEIIYYNYY